jgi:hypothetical protein
MLDAGSWKLDIQDISFLSSIRYRSTSSNGLLMLSTRWLEMEYR